MSQQQLIPSMCWQNDTIIRLLPERSAFQKDASKYPQHTSTVLSFGGYCTYWAEKQWVGLYLVFRQRHYYLGIHHKVNSVTNISPVQNYSDARVVFNNPVLFSKVTHSLGYSDICFKRLIFHYRQIYNNACSEVQSDVLLQKVNIITDLA